MADLTTCWLHYGYIFLLIFFFLSMLSQKHKWSWLWPTLKQQANFTAFYGRFYDVCCQINSWDVDTVLSVASPFTGQRQTPHTHAHPEHTQHRNHAFKAMCRFDSSSGPSLNASSAFPPFGFVFWGESWSYPLAPFPAGIKGLSDTCDPGNTFTRPEWGHHSNWY